MEYLKGGLVSVAASAAFLVLDNQLLSLAPAYKWVGAVGAFVVAALLVWWLSGKDVSDTAGNRKIISENKFKGNLKSDIEETSLTGKEGADVLSRNKVGGDTAIRITKSKL